MNPALCCHDKGLTLPANDADAAVAFIFLLFDSSSDLLLPDADADESGKMEEAMIAARLFFLFLSNFEANLTAAVTAASSSEGGRSRMPRPILLDTPSSSLTLLFWF